MKLVKPNLEKVLTDVFFKTSRFQFCLLLFLLAHLFIFYLFYYSNTLFQDPLNTFSDAFVRFDSNWYLTILNKGYSTSENYHLFQDYAFFPLYPILVAGFHFLTHASFSLSGVFVSNIAFFIALYFFYPLLIERGFDEKQTRFTLLLLSLSPANIYFVSVYTESLFLALSVLSIYFAFKSQWIRAFLFAGLISATRPNGICIILPLLLILGKEYLETRKFKLSYLGIILAPAGLVAYMVYLHLHVGNYLAFVHAQLAWGRTGWIHGHLWPQFRSQFLFSGYSTPFVFLFFLALYVLWKSKYYIELIYLLIMMAPAFMSGQGTGLGRFIMVLFPMYMACTLFVKNRPYLTIFTILSFGLFLGLNICAWTAGGWVV